MVHTEAIEELPVCSGPGGVSCAPAPSDQWGHSVVLRRSFPRLLDCSVESGMGWTVRKNAVTCCCRHLESVSVSPKTWTTSDCIESWVVSHQTSVRFSFLEWFVYANKISAQFLWLHWWKKTATIKGSHYSSDLVILQKKQVLWRSLPVDEHAHCSSLKC